MRLCEVALTNFRGYQNETRIKIDPLTVLIGKNDSGKSSVLEALNIFFNDEALEQADCCVHSQAAEIRIACTFDELPDSIIID
jgi:predicted ATP-dependent endonuclease of OLD family